MPATVSSSRRPLYVNSHVGSWRPSCEFSAPDEAILRFHNAMPDYAPTPLIPLKDVASEVGVRSVYVKFEGRRLGLPSFKILGASWAIFRALTNEVGLPLETDLGALKCALKARATPVKLFAATDGNHGRAVARMGALLGLSVRIYVPTGLNPTTIQNIREEGATVEELNCLYDSSVQIAFTEAEKAPGGIFIGDTAFAGYEEIPEWVVDGYSTMMREIDVQLQGISADLVVAPVGVGSFAQAVVSHFKSSENGSTKIMTVEADTSSCLYNSLTRACSVSLPFTVPTIMAGLNCGTVSTTAWPVLQGGVDASSTVSDFEAHEACEILSCAGIKAGPCGAAPLAALRRLTASDKKALNLGRSSVVVLLCTEGQREYSIPSSVACDDPVSLCQSLVRINSAVPGTGDGCGPGEVEIAQYIASWLEHRGIETHWVEPTKGRPSVIGIVRGTGGGKSLMLNGHIDTVTTASYEGDPLSGTIRDKKLYGRGAADMKCGVAAILIALAEAKQYPLKGDVIFTGVADEEDMSIGTEQVLQAGWRADAALVCEPTNEDLVVGHKGFVWLDADIHGIAAHGSRFDLGVDAIRKTGYFLVELDKLAERLEAGPKHPLMGSPSVHASIVKGGEEPASYPAKCTVTIERRTVPGESDEQVYLEIDGLLQAAAQQASGFEYKLRTTFSRTPFEIPQHHPFVSMVSGQLRRVSGKEPRLRGEAFWTDCALIDGVGMPVVMYGPHGEGLHAKEEWVNIESIGSVTSSLLAVIRAFCGSG